MQTITSKLLNDYHIYVLSVMTVVASELFQDQFCFITAKPFTILK